MADMEAISAALEGHLELPDESLVRQPPPCLPSILPVLSSCPPGQGARPGAGFRNPRALLAPCSFALAAVRRCGGCNPRRARCGPTELATCCGSLVVGAPLSALWAARASRNSRPTPPPTPPHVST